MESLLIAQRPHSGIDIYAQSGDGTRGFKGGTPSNVSRHPPPNRLFIKANILIDNDGHARLADFGLLTIVSDSTHSTTSSSSKNAGTTKWMSPELIDPDRFGFKNSRPTKESDYYALGMVVLEVLSGQAPFPSYTGLTVMRRVVDGERPERPQGPERVWFTDDLWEMLKRCWFPQPKHRPTPEVVFERLEEGSTAWRPLSPGVDDDFEAGSDDESVFTVGSYPCTFLYFVLNIDSSANAFRSGSNDSTRR